MCGAGSAFPSFCHLLRSRHTSVPVRPCPNLSRVDMPPQQPLELRWGRFRSAIPSPDLWLVLNDDFRPAASHIRSSPGETDRLSARIRPQAQRKQIGKTEGSLYMEPVVRPPRNWLTSLPGNLQRLHTGLHGVCTDLPACVLAHLGREPPVEASPDARFRHLVVESMKVGVAVGYSWGRRGD